jgi:two-component system, LuxR family, response regulator FixJ
VHARAVTRYLLASPGYTTQIYGGAEEFLAQANLDDGCVLMDVRMPEIDGFAALTRLAERVITIPTIMMTGYGDLTTAIKAMKLGAVDFLEKPHKESELVAAVERARDLGARDRL